MNCFRLVIYVFIFTQFKTEERGASSLNDDGVTKIELAFLPYQR